MSQLVIIWVNLLYGLDVDLSFPAAQNWQITLDFMAPVPFFSHGGVTFISAHMTVIGCWVSYFLCVSLDHLSHGNTLSLGFEQMCSDPEDLQVEGTTVSLHQANFGMSRMTKLPMRRLRGCQRTGGREGGRVGWVGVWGGEREGESAAPPSEEFWEPLWVSGEPGIQCEVLERALTAVVQCWGCRESPVLLLLSWASGRSCCLCCWCLWAWPEEL